MKKTASFTIALLLIVCCAGSGLAGYLFRQRTVPLENEKHAVYTLIKSYGWVIDEDSITEQSIVYAKSFKTWFDHMTYFDPSHGNVAGITHPLLDLPQYEFMNDESIVNIYTVPLAYDMPQGTTLCARIAVHEGAFCMTSVHVLLQDLENLDDANSLLPLTWSLDTDKQTIESWKAKYSTITTSVSIK